MRKEFIHILRDWRTTLITLVMPIVMLLIFGYALSTEVNNIDVMAVVPHPTEPIRQQLTRLSANPYITYLGTTTEAEMDTHLCSGKADAIIVYSSSPAGGCQEGASYQLVLDGSDANISATANIYLAQALNSDSNGGLTSNSASGLTAQGGLFITTIRHNPQLLSAYNFVPGVMGMLFLLICALMTSASIVREKETGTMEVLLVSPIRPQMVIIAKLIPFFVISMIDLAIVLLLVHYAMDVPLASIGSIIGVSVLYVVLSLSIGILVSALVDKQIVALLLCAMVFMLPVMLFSGMMFPVDNLPWILKPFPMIVPARWYIDAMRKLMIEGVPFAMVIKEFSILLGITIALLSVALKKFNDRLE